MHPTDKLHRQLIEQCDQLIDRVKLLRDYAANPSNVWLARGELSRISEQTGEIESLLAQIQRAG